MLTVDCQPLQSFAKLNECTDQFFFFFKELREHKRKDEESEMEGNGEKYIYKKRGQRERGRNWKPYKCLNIHVARKHTHAELWTPR